MLLRYNAFTFELATGPRIIGAEARRQTLVALATTGAEAQWLRVAFCGTTEVVP
jgi:hypothetical protein